MPTNQFIAFAVTQTFIHLKLQNPSIPTILPAQRSLTDSYIYQNKVNHAFFYIKTILLNFLNNIHWNNQNPEHILQEKTMIVIKNNTQEPQALLIFLVWKWIWPNATYIHKNAEISKPSCYSHRHTVHSVIHFLSIDRINLHINYRMHIINHLTDYLIIIAFILLLLLSLFASHIIIVIVKASDTVPSHYLRV